MNTIDLRASVNESILEMDFSRLNLSNLELNMSDFDPNTSGFDSHHRQGDDETSLFCLGGEITGTVLSASPASKRAKLRDREDGEGVGMAL